MAGRRAGVLLSACVLLLAACGQSSSPAAVAPAHCLINSPQLRSATAATLAGLDRGVFARFEVLMPPPPPIRSDDYRGPLWTYATLPGSRDRTTHDLVGVWEARLAQGAIAERCSLGLADLQQAVAGGTVRYATGTERLADEGSGFARAGLVFGAQADQTSDGAIVAEARDVLRRFGLTPRTVRVLHPLGPALLVEATTDDPDSMTGRIPDLETALDGGDQRHPRFEGVYLALDGPGGPLFVGEGTRRDAGGGGWTAPGFDSGIQHG
jgi:hypothetical protein